VVVAANAERPGVNVHCESVVHIYQTPNGAVVSLRGVDLDVDAGEALALLGPSGSGKSTLLSLLAGLIKPTAGRVRVGELDMNALSGSDLVAMRSGLVGLALQDAARNLLPYATAQQNVQFAQRRRAVRPRQLLEQLGIGSLAGRQVSTLGGGEQQQIALAVAVASEPRLLLLDEPTSQLDPIERDRVIELIRTLNDEVGMTVIAVTHDPAVAGSMPRTVTIRDGRVGSEGRRGEDYAVVGRDGTIQLPPDVLQLLPPGTLVRLHRQRGGVDLRHSDRQQ
jgi:ABC-type lipoprotein export system ATPase subunit